MWCTEVGSLDLSNRELNLADGCDCLESQRGTEGSVSKCSVVTTCVASLVSNASRCSTTSNREAQQLIIRSACSRLASHLLI